MGVVATGMNPGGKWPVGGIAPMGGKVLVRGEEGTGGAPGWGVRDRRTTPEGASLPDSRGGAGDIMEDALADCRRSTQHEKQIKV